jgi:hypothetical protein
MPYQHLSDGLYLLRQWSPEKGVWHFGILDVGNRIKNRSINRGSQPIVIHQTPPTIKMEWLRETGAWEVLGRIADEKIALLRINEAAKNPTYDLFVNNCQHFATYVATGVRQSTQVQVGLAIAGGVAMLAMLS